MALPSSDPYDPTSYPPFAVTADLVVLTVAPPETRVLLVQRGTEPFAGQWALPGGFVGPDQSLAEAARSKLADKTGVAVGEVHLEQLASFGAVDRDPRMRVVSVAHLAMLADPSEPVPGSDATAAAWVDLADVDTSALAFDHAEVLATGVARARAKLEYTTLATEFCSDEFTIAELRSVYEAVWQTDLDPANFHRKVLATDGFVEATGKTAVHGKGRPAKTYRAGPATTLAPPLHR